MRVAVLDDYQKVASKFADWSSLGSDVSVEFFHDHLTDEKALAQRLAPFDVLAIMRERTLLGRERLGRLPNLRLIVTTGMRNASVDVRACAERGITVCGTNSGGGTSELAWGLILGLARHLPLEDRSVREGRWQTTLGRELRGLTLGLLGLGRLGEAVARVGQAFGMQTIAWSQNLTAERAAACGVERVEKRDLFSRSDVLSIHLVLSDRTRGLVGATELALMKPTAYVINTSRGPIVDNAALIEALRGGKIAGAGIDVYEQEPLPSGDPILSAPNTLLSPHLGYVTEEKLPALLPWKR